MVTNNDFSPHTKMHQNNLSNAKKSMDKGITPVIIDNTNIKPSDVKPYVEYGLKNGYTIKVEDIGSNNLDTEALFKRNTHGVPLETINRMIQSHKSIGALTINKIMESKSRKKPYVWSSVKLDENSKNNLLSKVIDKIPTNWEVIGKHMTLLYGKTLESINKENLIGETLCLNVIGFGSTNKAFAVLVEGFDDIIIDKNPHITIAINDREGGKPANSKEITDWVLFNDLNKDNLKVIGKVVEIKSK